MTVQLVPNAGSISELLQRIDGIFGACGEASWLVMSHIYQGTPLTVQELVNIVKQAQQTAGVGQGGIARPDELANFSAQQGLPVNLTGAWQQAVVSYAGIRPVELGLTNAGALGGWDVGVNGHFITVVGKDTATGNYVVADPNQPQAKTGGFIEYSMQQLQNALPDAALVPTSNPSGVAMQQQSQQQSSGSGNGFWQGFWGAVTGVAGSTGLPTPSNPLDPITTAAQELGNFFAPLVNNPKYTILRITLFILGVAIILIALSRLFGAAPVEVENVLPDMSDVDESSDTGDENRSFGSSASHVSGAEGSEAADAGEAAEVAAV